MLTGVKVPQRTDQQVQTIRLDDLGKPGARLDGSWQFHAGDSPLAAGSGTAVATEFDLVGPLWTLGGLKSLS